MKKFLDKIPVLLSHWVSIYLFLFLFIYLVIFGVVGLFLPVVEPSSNVQLILGNYTNVTSALGAAIAAGASAANHQKHKKLEKSLVPLFQAEMEALYRPNVAK